MPKVRRQNIPPALLHHLLDRIQSRKIPGVQLELLATWLDTEPDVPDGQWFKRFTGMTVCGVKFLPRAALLERAEVITSRSLRVHIPNESAWQGPCPQGVETRAWGLASSGVS